MVSRRRNKKSKKLFFLIGICIIFVFGIIVVKMDLLKKSLFVSPIPPKFIAKSSGNAFLHNTELMEGEKIRTVEQGLKKSGISFSSVQIASDSAFLITVPEGEVLFSQDKDLASQISSLQRVLSRFTIEGKKFATLDFRFDRPVVTLK